MMSQGQQSNNERDSSDAPMPMLLVFNLVLLGLFALGYGAYQVFLSLRELVNLLAFTTLLAYLLQDPILYTQQVFRRRFPWLGRHSVVKSRLLALLTVYVGFFLLLTLLAAQLLPSLIEQVHAFSRQLPGYASQIQDQLEDHLSHMRSSGLLAESQHDLSRFTFYAQHYTSQTLGQAVGRLLSVLSESAARVVYALTSLVLVFYFLLDGHRIKQGALTLVPQKFRHELNGFIMKTHHVLYDLIRCQAAFGILAAVYQYILLSLFDVQFAGLLSFLFGFLAVIPVIGPWLGLLPLILTILLGKQPVYLPLILVGTGLLFLIKFYWLNPLFMKKHEAIHPVLIVLIFLLSIQLTGFLGVLLIFPMTALVSVWLQSRKVLLEM